MSECSFPILIGIPALVAPPAAWQPSTAYAVGDKVINAGNIYECSQSGTSAASGGPTGTGSAIVDNTCRWDYVSAIPGLPSIPTLTLPMPPCFLDEF